MKPEATVQPLGLTLEELYVGTVKFITVTRYRLDPFKNLLPNEKTFEINIAAGFKNGTKITFPLEGSESKDFPPADLIFVVEELPHTKYQRVKDDLLYTAQISLLDALTSASISVKTLDERTFQVLFGEIIHPNFKKIVEGEGMPITKTGQKGNLIISFDIVFPKVLAREVKEQLAVLLK